MFARWISERRPTACSLDDRGPGAQGRRAAASHSDSGRLHRLRQNEGNRVPEGQQESEAACVLWRGGRPVSPKACTGALVPSFRAGAGIPTAGWGQETGRGPDCRPTVCQAGAGSSSSRRQFWREPVPRSYNRDSSTRVFIWAIFWRFTKHENILKAPRNPTVKDLSKLCFPEVFGCGTLLLRSP